MKNWMEMSRKDLDTAIVAINRMPQLDEEEKAESVEIMVDIWQMYQKLKSVETMSEEELLEAMEILQPDEEDEEDDLLLRPEEEMVESFLPQPVNDVENRHLLSKVIARLQELQNSGKATE